MTMFEELFALASGATLTLTISADGKAGQMTINVIPRPRKDFDEPALTQALSLTATPQEFDTGFVAALKGYREVRKSLTDQLEATQEVLEAVKAASVKRATEANVQARPSKPGPMTKPVPIAHAPSTGAEPQSLDEANTPTAQPREPAPVAGEDMDLFG